MADLICVAFDDPTTADRALTELTALQKEYLIELKDACVVVRAPDGEVHLHQSVPLVKTGALTGGTSGALWGTLIGLLFLNPALGIVVVRGLPGERPVVGHAVAVVVGLESGVADEVLFLGECHTCHRAQSDRHQHDEKPQHERLLPPPERQYRPYSRAASTMVTRFSGFVATPMEWLDPRMNPPSGIATSQARATS